MNDGTNKIISEIKLGDLLINNNEVTSIIKVITTGSIMYNLNGVIVSDSHIIKYKDKWIHVSKHPDSKKINTYNEPFLYCLNTSLKIITINDVCFTDWDEIYDNDINKIKTFLYKKNNNFESIDIHKYFNNGINGETIINLKNGTSKKIQDIEIGDILEEDETVYGLVKINGENIDEQSMYYLGKNKLFEGSNNLYFLVNETNLDKISKQTKNKKDNILYHLLTDKKTFNINKIKIYDYNASIDLFLNKNKIIIY
jgi:hypothetical protein